MNRLSTEEIYQEISKIVSQFTLLQCDQCAKTIIQWLKVQGIEGKILRLRTKYKDEDYIISDRLERQGILDSITTNGQHCGVEVLGKVFDNLGSEGIQRDNWLQDFHCLSEEFILEELEDLKSGDNQ